MTPSKGPHSHFYRAKIAECETLSRTAPSKLERDVYLAMRREFAERALAAGEAEAPAPTPAAAQVRPRLAAFSAPRRVERPMRLRPALA